MSENILEIKNLSKYFGGLAAVSDCSLKVSRGTITGIIGPNGSGKTTLPRRNNTTTIESTTCRNNTT